MNIAVRYCSRSGNTKAAAEAIAEALGVTALSVDDHGAVPEEKVDLLFLGGALYAYGIDDRLKTFITALSPENVGKAALFSTSRLSKHALDVMRKALRAKGILLLRQQTKSWFSNVQLPEPLSSLGLRLRIPIPTSFCLLVEQ